MLPSVTINKLFTEQFVYVYYESSPILHTYNRIKYLQHRILISMV